MLLDYAHKHSNIRSITMGYQFISYSHFIAGDLPLAIEYAQRAIQISVDPLYSIGGNLLIGFSHAFLGEFQKIGEMAKQTWKFCRDVGCEVWGTLAKILAGVTYIPSGQMSQGLKKAEDHFNKAIEIAKEVGTNSYMARAYLDLGLLHKAKKRTDQAKECICKAIELFEQCEAEVYLKQAREALTSLD